MQLGTGERRCQGEEGGGPGVPGQPDDGQDPTWAQQAGHPAQCGRGVHVVHRGDRGDQVERAGLERRGAEVTEQVTDVARPGMAAGQLDAAGIPVDAADLWYDRSQAAGERALPAADVESPLAAWHGAEHHPVVVQIVAPALRGQLTPDLLTGSAAPPAGTTRTRPASRAAAR